MTSKPATSEDGSPQHLDDDLESDLAGPEDPTFAAILSEVACAPALRADRQLARGERVGEHQIMGVVGRGAFGTVYRAVHPVLEREVAIKVLSSSHADDPGVAQRFVDEARAIHRIRHPNLVEVSGFGELPNGQLYYAMELLTGRTLAAHLEESGAFAPELALYVLSQVAQALDAAHAQGVLHRDLKPDNVFIDGALALGCRVKLLDFGIAKLLGEGSVVRTRSGMLIGTPAYMSPEQCGGEPMDERSDVYSLGVIAFELLTGKRPFAGKTIRETMAQHMFEAPPRASERASTLPATVDAPLLAMLSKVPAERPASAGAAVKTLALGLGLAVADGSDEKLPATRPAGTRARYLLLVAALGVALLVVAWVRRQAPVAGQPTRAPVVELRPKKPEPAVARETRAPSPAAVPAAMLPAPVISEKAAAPKSARPRPPARAKSSRNDLEF
jgi:tRNA A-37 threonylcarbamoyl transferase component Bud32